LVPSDYFHSRRFVIFSPELDLQSARSIFVYSKSVASASVQAGFTIKVMPEDMGTGGTISILGKGFNSGMRVALGRSETAGLLTETQFVSETFIDAEVPSYIPANDLFVSVVNVDGKTRSEPAPVMSSFPERENDATQHRPIPMAPSQWNEAGLKLMKIGNYESAAEKFVEAARSDSSNFGSAPNVSEASAAFANNAGFAFFKAEKYAESAFWLERACEIDPKRAVAYLNLGDALRKLNQLPEARRSYRKYLELAASSKAAPEVRQQLDALPPSPSLVYEPKYTQANSHVRESSRSAGTRAHESHGKLCRTYVPKIRLVTRAAENSCTDRIIGFSAPFCPLAFLVSSYRSVG